MALPLEKKLVGANGFEGRIIYERTGKCTRRPLFVRRTGSGGFIQGGGGKGGR